MLRDGLFTRFPKPDYALGMHDEHSLPAGVIGFHSGYFRANSTGLDMTVYGKGGHGAFPQSAIDPVVIAARIVLSLQTIVSRETNPMDPAVITVGSIHGGSASNIIPDQVKLQITVRSLDPVVHKRLLAAIERQAKGEALAANAPKEPLIEMKSNTDAVYNDPELTQRRARWLRCQPRWAAKTSRNSAWQACAPCCCMSAPSMRPNWKSRANRACRFRECTRRCGLRCANPRSRPRSARRRRS
jgi:amidohydrolase